jgi:uridine kinase
LLGEVTAGRDSDRRLVVGIDGGSSSGKTTVARRISCALERSWVVHTDDVAWHHSRFGWVDLLVAGVLEPFRRGSDVAFRPPAWETRGRAGNIEVPIDARLVVVEGVGAIRRSLADHYDARLWIQTDRDETERRNRERVANGELSHDVLEGWMSEEVQFLTSEQPWWFADAIVAGESHAESAASTGLVIAPPLRKPTR